MTAFAQNSPSVEWGNLIDGTTSAGDQSTDVRVGKDGGVYWFGTYGSTESAPDVSYAGEYLYTGALYNAGNSQNNNFTLLKTNAAGEKEWAVYSNSGDFANNNGGIAFLPDSAVVVVSKVRHTDGMTDKNIVLVDAEGNETELEWTCSRRYYRMLATKISKDGEIEWNHFIDFSTEPGPAASGNTADFWADCFNLGSIDTDSQGNIYIALNYRNIISIPTSTGYATIDAPINGYDTWSGDAQLAVGNFMVLSLDKDGWYRDALHLEGKADCSYCQKVSCINDVVYAQGYIKGDNAGSTISMQGIDFKPTTIMSPLLVATDTNFKMKWAKCFPGEQVAGKNALQNCGFGVSGDYLYFVGQYNLKFTDPVEPHKYVASTQGSVREGFVVKFDAATGEWLAARDSRDDNWSNGGTQAKTGLTGYMNVVANEENPDEIYVVGYVMNANVGVFMRRYDANTLVGDLDGEFNIVTQGGVPSFQVSAYDPAEGALYLTARGNKAFALLGAESTSAPQSWGIVAAKVALPAGYTSAIGSVEVDDENAPVEYFNLQGIRVANPESGLYIRRQGSKVSKIVL